MSARRTYGMSVIRGISTLAVVFGGSAARAQATRAPGAHAPLWNDSTTRMLVARAIAEREQQLTYRGLTDYQARAHGYLTFLVQVGPGFPDAPRIVKSDELAVGVYWHAPNLSKEVVVGHRDTLLLPADIGYYTDRYGITQNNFPDSIRMGDANDVRDVPHPLSARGADIYDYATVDSLRIRTPNRAIDVYAVRVRPRNDRAPRVVGTLYLDRASGALARMAITFTRAAIIDHRIERLSVTLDNSLVEGRFWLPQRQELEVVRTGTWLDYPFRGIIRGHWDVCCYAINRGLPPMAFGGPEIVAAPPAVQAIYPWHGKVLDSIPPDVRVVSSEDVRQVQATARDIVRATAVNRAHSALLSAHGVSDFARVNRVEGLALGAGVAPGVTPAWDVSLRGRYGFADRAGKGEGTLSWHAGSGLTVHASAYRSYRDVADEPESSTLINSIASEAFGADRTDPYDARGVGVSVVGGDADAVRWHVGLQRETQGPLGVHAGPLTGFYGATVPAWRVWETRATVGLDGPTRAGPLGTEWRATTELHAGWFHRRDSAFVERNPLVGHAFGTLEVTRPFAPDRLLLRTTIATVAARGGTAAIPPQDFVFLGGPVSAPGYSYHEFVGRLSLTEHLEWQLPVSVPVLPLSRYTIPTFIPFVHAAYIDQRAPFAAPRQGWYPAVGLGLSGVFNLVRLDIARGLRNGRWTFDFDVSHDFWGIL